MPSPGFQVEVVLVDYDGSQPPKQKTADRSADKKSDADSSTSSSAKENHAVHVESNKEAGGDDKDDVFSDNEAEDGSSKGKKEKVSSTGQGTAKASETSVAQKEASAASSGMEKVTISTEQGNARAPDATSLKTEASSKSSSTTAQPPGVESSSMSEFKAIAADASVFSFGDEDEYESE